MYKSHHINFLNYPTQGADQINGVLNFVLIDELSFFFFFMISNRWSTRC